MIASLMGQRAPSALRPTAGRPRGHQRLLGFRLVAVKVSSRNGAGGERSRGETLRWWRGGFCGFELLTVGPESRPGRPDFRTSEADLLTDESDFRTDDP